MKRLLIFMCLIAMMIIPASAQTVSYTAPEDMAIEHIWFVADGGTSGTVLFTTSTGSTISGTWSYLQDSGIAGYANAHEVNLQIGSDSDSLVYVTWGPIHITIDFLGKFFNMTTNRAVMGASQMGVINNVAVETPLPAAIIQYTITADKEIEVHHTLTTRNDAEARLNPSSENDIIEQLKGYFNSFWSVFTALIFWLKFLFVDNLTLVVVLYVTGSMAYAINTSKNIFVFYKTWLRQQTALYKFISQMFSAMINVAAQIIASLKPL